MSDIPMFVGNIQSVELSKLQVDLSYQRGLKGSARRMAKNLDPRAVGVLHVGKRIDGSLWIIDGQQRTHALIKSGYTHWDAYVIESDGSSFEATIFALINGGRTQLTPQEVFRGKVESKDPAALAVVRAVKAAGLELNTNRAGNVEWPNVKAVSTLYRLVTSSGEEAVTRALKCLAETWPQQSDALRERLIQSFLRLHITYQARIDDARMIKQLRMVSPVKIINEAAGSGRDVYIAAMDFMAAQYNKRLILKNRIRVEEETSHI